MKRYSKELFAMISLVVLGAVTVGCEPKDTDPHEKIDAPGYYNGPIKPKAGGPVGGPGAGQKPSAPPTGQ